MPTDGFPGLESGPPEESHGRNRRYQIAQPKASRPHMAGYGVPESLEGSLPWEWARERISKSHNYWLTTVRPDGAPHTMVVWGIWLDGAYYFSTNATSRKARNLQQNPNCVVCTENAEEAVIIRGCGTQAGRRQDSSASIHRLQSEIRLGARPEDGAGLRGATTGGFCHARKAVPQRGHALEV